MFSFTEVSLSKIAPETTFSSAPEKINETIIANVLERETETINERINIQK